jgi:hypothetical protein
LNVIKSPVGLDVGVEVLAELSIQQLEQMANVVEPVSNKSLVLPAGKAQKLSYKMKLTLPDQTQITLATAQFIFLKDKTLYVITLAVKADRAAKYASAFDKIGESFRFLP